MSLVDGFYGDTTPAFETLYAVAHAVAAGRLPSHLKPHAEDIAQESVTAIYSSKPAVSSEGEIKAYTIKTALAKTVDYCRRQAAQKRGGGKTVSLDGGQGEDRLISHTFLLEDALGRLSTADVNSILRSLADDLPEGYRLVLLDYYFHGLQQCDIATKRNLPLGSVGVFIRRGLEGLRAALTRAPRLQEELRAYVEDPKSLTVILPIVAVFCLDFGPDDSGVRYAGDEENPGGGQTGGLVSVPRNTSERTLPDDKVFSRMSEQEQLSAMKRLPSDKPAKVAPKQGIYERWLVSIGKPLPQPAKQTTTKSGCALLLLALFFLPLLVLMASRVFGFSN